MNLLSARTQNEDCLRSLHLKSKILHVLALCTISVFSFSQNISWVLPLVNHANFNNKVGFVNFGTDVFKNVYFNANYSPSKNNYFPVAGKIGTNGTINWLVVDSVTSAVQLQVNLDKSNSLVFASSWDTTSVYHLNGQKKGDIPVGFEDLEVINGSIYGITQSVVCKSDYAGNIAWAIPGPWKYPVQISKADSGFMYIRYGDGGFGYCFVSRIDTLGNILWTGQVPLGYVREIVSDEAGNCYVMQKKNIYKIDKFGSVLWMKACVNEPTTMHYSKNLTSLITAENDLPNNQITIALYNVDSLSVTSQINITNDLNAANWSVQGDYYHVTRIKEEGQSIFLGGAYVKQITGECFIARLDLLTTGVLTHLTNERKIEVSPNPSAGNTEIKVPWLATGEITYTLLNSSLQEVLSAKITSQEGKNFTLQTDELPAGIYFLSVKTDQEVVTTKIVIQ